MNEWINEWNKKTIGENKTVCREIYGIPVDEDLGKIKQSIVGAQVYNLRNCQKLLMEK